MGLYLSEVLRRESSRQKAAQRENNSITRIQLIATAEGDLAVYHKLSFLNPGISPFSLWLKLHPQTHQQYHLLAPWITAITQPLRTRAVLRGWVTEVVMYKFSNKCLPDSCVQRVLWSSLDIMPVRT